MQMERLILVLSLTVALLTLGGVLAQGGIKKGISSGLGRTLGRSLSMGRRPRGFCDYKSDIHSPFYFPGQENLCTKDICARYPDLGCDIDEYYLNSQIGMHWPENITEEVMYLQEYFDTLIPPPVYSGNYTCKGVCERPPMPLKNIFLNADVYDMGYGKFTQKRWMCHVIGPKLYYRECGGPCDVLYGSTNMFCVADVKITVDVWVFCENLEPGCRKVQVDIPLSCGCRKFKCKNKRPEILDAPPNLPDWVQIAPLTGGGGRIDINGPNIDMGQPAQLKPVGIGNH